MIRKNYITVILLTLISCSNHKKTEEENRQIILHSYAEPENVVVKHLDLNLDVNFDEQYLHGIAVWTIENKKGHDEIVFDTRDLIISKIILDDNMQEEPFFALGDKDDILGQPLSILIKPETKKIAIHYTTSKTAAALQWVNPGQTAGKNQPFLYTQSQAILARSWIPCQDDPSIRFTYNATVTVPQHLLALMSAENPQAKNQEGKYHFKQPHPIPSYLMALAVGDIAFRKIDDITGVYAEPATLEKAAYEFADMGKMVKAAEKLYGKYLWGRYDVLVLPPSFPFGGMENPMLTFATPTIIAGDRSLVSVIAHELAHSWSGNLVTNASWNDFWLNEGFTVYFERRIIEEIYGKPETEMLEVLGYNDLLHAITDMGNTHPDTRLNLDLTNRDPDDGVTDIAYEKGALFLKNIELAAGREKFDSFLKDYFKKYAFKSISLDQFETELENNLIKGNETLKNQINAYAWIYRPGIPENIVSPKSSRFSAIDSLKDNYLKNNNITISANDVKSTNEKLYFIRSLPDTISINQLQNIDQVFDFTHSLNAEIQSAWYTLGIRKDYAPIYPEVRSFLLQVGRRKFLEPLYRELIKTEKGKSLAKAIYQDARPGYHSVAYQAIDKIIE